VQVAVVLPQEQVKRGVVRGMRQQAVVIGKGVHCRDQFMSGERSEVEKSARQSDADLYCLAVFYLEYKHIVILFDISVVTVTAVTVTAASERVR
jgi:hypothetical protein